MDKDSEGLQRNHYQTVYLGGVECLRPEGFKQPIPGIIFDQMAVYQQKGSGPISIESPKDRIDIYYTEIAIKWQIENGSNLINMATAIYYMDFKSGWDPEAYMKAADDMYAKMKGYNGIVHVIANWGEDLSFDDYANPMSFSNWKIVKKSIFDAPDNRRVYFQFANENQYEHASKALVPNPDGPFYKFGFMSRIFRNLMDKRTFFSFDSAFDAVLNTHYEILIEMMSKEQIVQFIGFESFPDISKYERYVIEEAWSDYMESIKMMAAISNDDKTFEIRLRRSPTLNFTDLLNLYEQLPIETHRWIRSIALSSETLTDTQMQSINESIENNEISEALRNMDILTLSDVVTGIMNVNLEVEADRKKIITQIFRMLDRKEKGYLALTFNLEEKIKIKKLLKGDS